MHVESYGGGPRAALALHGWGGDHREFAPVAARRPPDGRLLSPDLPGYGHSALPSAWDPEAVLDPLVRELERLALGPIPVAGFCSGAFPALLLARDHPQFVSRVALIDPFYRVPWYFRHFTWGWFGRKAYSASFQGAGRGIINGVLRRRQASGADFTRAFEQLCPDVVVRYLKMLSAHGHGGAFAELRLPVDLVYGEHTFRAVREGVRRFAVQWPQARVHRLNGVGHFPLAPGARTIARLLWPAGADTPLSGGRPGPSS